MENEKSIVKPKPISIKPKRRYNCCTNNNKYQVSLLIVTKK